MVPHFHRPQITLPPSWGTTIGDGAHVSLARLGWWRDFDSPELDRLMQRSLQGDFNLEAAAARIEEAEGTAEVDGAPMLPTLAAIATLGQNNGVKNSGTQDVLGVASYELDFWGRNSAAAASGKALVSASAYDADTVAMTLSASVADSYFQILSLNERILLARHIAGDARRILGLVQVQQQAGTATELQVEQQRAAVETFDAAVPALQQQADQALHLLAVLSGRVPEGFTVTASNLQGLARPVILPDLPSTLLEQRPDIRAAEARLVAANFDIGVARAAFFPAITLTGAVGIGAKHLFFPPAVLTQLGSNLVQPLFQGGQLSGQLRYDRARKLELVAIYRQTVIAAFQDVEDALSTLAHVQVQVAIEIKAEAAARKAAELAQLQYRLGSSDYLSVLTTEEALYQTQDAVLQLRLQRLQAIVGLFRALGGGFNAPAGPVVAPATVSHLAPVTAKPSGV